MNLYKNFNILMLTCFLVLSFLVPIQSMAFSKVKVSVEEQGDFVLEPGKTEVILNSGDTVTKSISVVNRMGQPMDFEILVEDFKGSDKPNETIVLMGDEKGPYSLKDFITPEIRNFSLESGEKITVPFDISLPKGTPPGGYYGAVIISNKPSFGDETESSGSINITSRLGSLILLKVPGAVNESGGLVGVSPIGVDKKFYQKPPDGFEVAFQNTGNVHLVPYGTVEIKNIFGKVVDILPVDAYFVLPDTTRYREVIWEEPSNFLVGFYKVQANINRGYGDLVDTQSYSFWIVPWKILSILIAIVVLLSLFVWFFVSKFELKRK